MELVRWGDLDDFFRRFFPPSTTQSGTLTNWRPAVDVTETQEDFVIKAELPEMKKEDITLSVDGGVLTLSGERKQEAEEKGKTFHRVERSYGKFSRSFSLPKGVQVDKIAATYADGVLHVSVPKAAEPAPEGKRVPIL